MIILTLTWQLGRTVFYGQLWCENIFLSWGHFKVRPFLEEQSTNMRDDIYEQPLNRKIEDETANSIATTKV